MNKTHHIEMLGGLRLRIGSETFTRFRTQKTASLLGYLALYLGRSQTREELVDLFWPDSDIDAGRASLRASLASLRQQLEPDGIGSGKVLIADRTFVRLNSESIDTDVSQFETGWAAATRLHDPAERAEALAAAADLYRGPFLSGHYDDWIMQERDRLQQIYTSILRSAASSLREVGEVSRALQCLQRLVAVEPLMEEAHADLMRLYTVSGNVPAALRQYRDLERILREELDTTPSVEAKDLFEQLSRGDVPGDLKDLARMTRRRPKPVIAVSPNAELTIPPSPPPAPETQPSAIGKVIPLPVMLTRFFGRENEIAQIQEVLQSGGARLLTLTGPGGSGKTRLALEVAHRLAELRPSLVAFVPLSELSDARLIPDTVAQALEIPKESGVSPIEQIADVLQNRPSLLLLDSFEGLVDGGAQTVLQLLKRVPTLTCLVTSRQRLEVGGEQEFAVSPLPVPTMAGNPEHLRRFASVELFVDRAQSARPGFALSPENAAAIAAVCERLEGIPLAIELAAAWGDILTPAQILARLTHRFELLASRRKDLAPRHQTLRSAFDWSYRLLTPEAQRFFSMMSVFRGGWTLEAAEEVCEEPHSLEYLQQLRERSLLIAHESGDEMRFRLLDTLRDYAGGHLPQAEKDRCRTRHLRYYLALAARANEFQHGPKQTSWLSRLEQEHDNFRAALEWALESPEELENGLRLAGRLQFFWGVRSHVIEGLRWYAALISKAEGADAGPISETVLAGARHGAGVMSFSIGDFAGAREHLQEAIRLYRAEGDLHGEADAQTFLGLSTDQGDHFRAREIFRTAKELYEQIGDEGGLAHAYKCMATNAQYLGDPAEARVLIERGLALYRKRGDHRGISMMLGQLAVLMLAQGQYAQAEEILKEHLQLSRDLNDMGHTALALENLGKALRGRGDYYLARGYFEQCLSVYRELGHRWGTVTALHNLGFIAIEQGNFEEARTLMDHALQLGREIGEVRSVAAVLADQGILAHRMGDYSAARARYQESAAAYREQGDRWGETKTFRDLGLLALDEGNLEEAEELENRSLELARETGDRHSEAMALYNLGDIHRHRGDFSKARALWEQCRATDRELGIKGGAALGALGTLAAHAGDFARARKLWTASLKEHWGIGDRLGAAECIEALADIALEEGQAEKAARFHGTAVRLREIVGAVRSARRRGLDAERVSRLKSELGEKEADSLIEEGRELALDKAVVVALKESEDLAAR